MSKPWEETWKAAGLGVAIGEDDMILTTTAPRSGSIEDLNVADARARLAAAAPELVRALLAIEADTSDYCPMCGFRFGGTHEEFCPWDAALRKAGVR